MDTIAFMLLLQAGQVTTPYPPTLYSFPLQPSVTYTAPLANTLLAPWGASVTERPDGKFLQTETWERKIGDEHLSR